MASFLSSSSFLSSIFSQGASPMTTAQAIPALRLHENDLLDPTERDCKDCLCRYGGFDLLMHIHHYHNLDYSDICPCESCVMTQLLSCEAVVENWRQDGCPTGPEDIFAVEPALPIPQHARTSQKRSCAHLDSDYQVTPGRNMNKRVATSQNIGSHTKGYIAPTEIIDLTAGEDQSQQYNIPPMVTPNYSSPMRPAASGTYIPTASEAQPQRYNIPPMVSLDHSSPMRPAGELMGEWPVSGHRATPGKTMNKRVATSLDPNSYMNSYVAPTEIIDLDAYEERPQQYSIPPMGEWPISGHQTTHGKTVNKRVATSQDPNSYMNSYVAPTEIIDIDAYEERPQQYSIPPMVPLQHSSPMGPAAGGACTQTVSVQHNRVDSASPSQNLQSRSLKRKISESERTEIAQPESTSLKKRKYKRLERIEAAQPESTGLKLLPNNVNFHQPNPEISERNLPYELSKIEPGELHADNGRVTWMEKATTSPPLWLHGDDNVVKSNTTGKDLRWLEFLPHEIPKSVPGWQLVCWQREASAQGITLKQQDIIDRMPDALTSSGITSRVQKWQRDIGMLLSTRGAMVYNWPSKQSMDTVAGLDYMQAKFNTWWDVGYLAEHNMWLVRQPQEHPGYRTPVQKSSAAKTEPPFYFVQNPEHRQASECIKLIEDAMLFLTLKAEECGMKEGYSEILSWFGRPAEDKWTENLELDLILEFQRWREGCPETPSLEILRTALGNAGSQAEFEAIKRADYSFTPWLQNVDVGLAPMRDARRVRDGQTRSVVNTKSSKRVSKKRPIEEVTDAEVRAVQAKPFLM